MLHMNVYHWNACFSRETKIQLGKHLFSLVQMSQSTLQSLQLHVDDAKQSLLQNSMHMLYLYINVVFYETFDRKEKQGIA